jgi:hypothetical protein
MDANLQNAQVHVVVRGRASGRPWLLIPLGFFGAALFVVALSLWGAVHAGPEMWAHRTAIPVLAVFASVVVLTLVWVGLRFAMARYEGGIPRRLQFRAGREAIASLWIFVACAPPAFILLQAGLSSSEGGGRDARFHAVVALITVVASLPAVLLTEIRRDALWWIFVRDLAARRIHDPVDAAMGGAFLTLVTMVANSSWFGFLCRAQEAAGRQLDRMLSALKRLGVAVGALFSLLIIAVLALAVLAGVIWGGVAAFGWLASIPLWAAVIIVLLLLK